MGRVPSTEVIPRKVQLAHRSQQIRVVDDVPLAIRVQAIQGEVLVAVLIFADLDINGNVGVTDLLILLGVWGACP